VNYSIYTNENGIGRQLFYISPNFIGDTLSIIGFINTDDGRLKNELRVVIQ